VVDGSKEMPEMWTGASCVRLAPPGSCASPRTASFAGRPFVSAKTTAVVPVKCCFVWDALVLASLDPSVRRIDYLRWSQVRSAPVNVDAIVLVRDDRRFLLDVVPARPVRDLDAEGLVLIALSALDLPTLYLRAEDIRREPLLSNSRRVWSYRMHPVGITMRTKVLSRLRKAGPMALSALITAICSDRDEVPAIMAMACANLVELDLSSARLGPATTIRCQV
jgi:hypothetical protein